MKLSDFIRQHVESFFAYSPSASTNVGQSGRDRCGFLCDVLTAAVAAAEAAQAPAGDAVKDVPPAQSHVPRSEALASSAARHADLRQSQGQPLEQVVGELQSLQSLVSRAWLQQAQSAPENLPVETLLAFTEAMGAAVAAVAARYETRLQEAAAQQAELHARLAESEQRFRALVNASSHVVYRLSPDGTEMRELDGRGTVTDTRRPTRSWLDEYVLPSDQPVAVEAFRQAVGNKAPYEVEHRYRRVNGKIGWTLSRAVPLFDEQGRIIEWFGAATDITARRQAEETLREADRHKEEFLVVLGHELRNPLAPLRTCVKLLAEAPRKPALIETLHPMMDRQLSHLVRLVDDLLDMSRIRQGRIELQQQRIDLNDPLSAALEQARSAIIERRHRLEVRLADAPLPVYGDGVRLTQVVANLLNNAARYMEPGGRIVLSSGIEAGQAVVRVRDQGYGIAPEHFDKLFKLYNQIDEHRLHAGESGLGVGLALSHQLVTLHGGTIEARSEGPGRGSEFIVRLQLLDQALTSRVAS